LNVWIAVTTIWRQWTARIIKNGNLLSARLAA